MVEHAVIRASDAAEDGELDHISVGPDDEMPVDNRLRVASQSERRAHDFARHHELHRFFLLSR